MPAAQRAYGSIVSRVAIAAAVICLAGPPAAMLAPGRNVLNPHLLFPALWEGKTSGEVWELVGEGFPGGHFYAKNFLSGDGLAQFGIVLGSTAALWGLLAAFKGYLKEKSYGYAAACLLVSALIIFAMTGVVKLK